MAYPSIAGHLPARPPGSPPPALDALVGGREGVLGKFLPAVVLGELLPLRSGVLDFLHCRPPWRRAGPCKHAPAGPGNTITAAGG